MEEDRVARERAAAQEKVNQQRKPKVYDDIVFDSSAISQIHPRLHKTKVHHLQWIIDTMDMENVQYDSEYFLMRPEGQEDEDEYESEDEDAPKQQAKPKSKFDEMLGKVDKMLTDIGL